MILYLASPYTSENPGEVIRNIERVFSVARELRERGHKPLIPHSLHWYGVWYKRVMGSYPSYESMMDWCFGLLEKCDAVVIIESSPGTNREIERAQELGKPIYDLRDKTVSIPSADYQQFHASHSPAKREDSLPF